tara:strand:- start:437 stop:1063 length:627 start_codon:yes stop_codon:yes gene_type:complete
MKKVITILKYKHSGNTGSLKNILNSLDKSNFKIQINSSSESILKSDALILPGVGNFKNVLGFLEDKKLIKVIKRFIKSGKPTLAICIGMQILFDHSDEGNTDGLKYLKGKIIKLNSNKKLKVPSVGWYKTIKSKKNIFLKDFENHEYFYYIHSYYADINNKNILMYYFHNKKKIPSLLKFNNLICTQFHPELSGHSGKKIFNLFLKKI